MPEQMVYDPRVADLQDHCSFGTLGVLNTLVIRSDDNRNMKRRCIIINGGTIVRNCYDKNKTDADNLKAIALDFNYIRQYFASYANNGIMLTYFHPRINTLIPASFQRKETDTRLSIDRLTGIVADSESLQPNKLSKFDGGNNVHYGMLVSGMFAYRVLSRVMRSESINPQQMWLVTHCPIDYFLFDDHPGIQLISSHTGKILTKKDLPLKVFKDESIPFCRTTYKLFGDKEFIRPLCQNKPKAMTQLSGIKLRLKTEREIVVLAKNKLGIDTKLLRWDL